MIPTTFRSKIPKTHSYPVGAELVTDFLGHVPQLDRLTLMFYGLWAKGANNWQPSLSVNYINIRENQYSSKELAAQGFYQDKWEIVVYPVLREHKNLVSTLLKTGALLRVKRWLIAPRTSTWLEGRRTLWVLFDEVSESLQYQES
jgi:hypothetical protein